MIAAPTATHDHFYSGATFWLGVGAILVPLIIWLAGLFRTRRRAFYVRSDAPGTRLLDGTDSIPGSQFEIRHNGLVLEDPHIVHIEFYNAGPSDITSSDFDAGNPVVVQIGSRIARVIDASDGNTDIPQEVDENLREKYGPGALFLAPMLIPQKRIVAVTVLAYGPAKIKYISSLKNVDVYGPGETSKRDMHRIVLLIGATCGVGVGAGLLTSGISSWPLAALTGGWVAIGAGMGLTTLHDRFGRKPPRIIPAS